MRTLWQVIFCLGILAACGQAAPVRLAVLEIDSARLGKLATLLESELVQLPDIEPLERVALQDILKEQKLQAAISAGANAERMRLAKLLKADVLVTLQAQKKPSVKTALARYREPRREIVAIPSLLDASLMFEQTTWVLPSPG